MPATMFTEHVSHQARLQPKAEYIFVAANHLGLLYQDWLTATQAVERAEQLSRDYDVAVMYATLVDVVKAEHWTDK